MRLLLINFYKYRDQLKKKKTDKKNSVKYNVVTCLMNAIAEAVKDGRMNNLYTNSFF